MDSFKPYRTCGKEEITTPTQCTQGKAKSPQPKWQPGLAGATTTHQQAQTINLESKAPKCLLPANKTQEFATSRMRAARAPGETATPLKVLALRDTVKVKLVQPYVPNLSAETTSQDNMVHGFWFLVTHDTHIVLL